MQRRLMFLANLAYAIWVYRRGSQVISGEPGLVQEGRGGDTDLLLAQKNKQEKGSLNMQEQYCSVRDVSLGLSLASLAHNSKSVSSPLRNQSLEGKPVARQEHPKLEPPSRREKLHDLRS